MTSFRLGAFREGREAAQVREHDRDVATMTLQRIADPVDEEVGHLGRQEAAQAIHALDLRDLLRHAAFEPVVPGRKLAGLPIERFGLRPHGIVQRLEAQHGTHAGEKRGEVEGLGEVVVAARIQAPHDVAGVRPGRQ